MPEAGTYLTGFGNHFATEAVPGALPIGLAHRVRLLRDVPEGAVLRYADVEALSGPAAEARRAMEARHAPAATEAAD